MGSNVPGNQIFVLRDLVWDVPGNNFLAFRNLWWDVPRNHIFVFKNLIDSPGNQIFVFRNLLVCQEPAVIVTVLCDLGVKYLSKVIQYFEPCINLTLGLQQDLAHRKQHSRLLRDGLRWIDSSVHHFMLGAFGLGNIYQLKSIFQLPSVKRVSFKNIYLVHMESRWLSKAAILALSMHNK